MIDKWVNLDNKLQEFFNAYDNEQYGSYVDFLLAVSSILFIYAILYSMYYIYLLLHHLLFTILIFIKTIYVIILYLCKIRSDINLSLYRSVAISFV